MLIRRLSVEPPAGNNTKKNVLFNMAGCLCYQCCQWLITVLVVLVSGYDASGLLTYSMSIGNIFLPIATFNMRTYQISDISGQYSQGNFVAFRLITVAIAYLLVIPYLVFTASDVATITTCILYLLFKTDEAICDVLSGIHQRGARMDYIGVSQFSRGILLLIVFTLAMKFANSINIAFICMSVACSLVTILYDLPHILRFGDLDISIKAGQVRRLFVDCLPMVIFTTVISFISTFCRQKFSDMYGITELGYYAAVATPTVLVQAASRYFYAPLLVPLSEKLNMGGSELFRSSLYKTTVCMILILILVCVPLYFFLPMLLVYLYGSDISGFTYLIAGTLVVTVLIAVVNFLTDCLVICRDIKGALIASLTGAFVAFLFADSLMRAYSMNGINMALCVSMSSIIIISCIRLMRTN